MNPSIKWLNGDTNRLFLLDSDSYSLYQVNEKKKDDEDEPGTATTSAQFEVALINSCSACLPGAKQEQEVVRSFALDHSAANRLAIGFPSGRVSIVSANIDPFVKFIRGEDIRDAQRSIAFLDWSHIDLGRLCAVYERGRGPDHTVVVYDVNRSQRGGRDPPMTVFESNFAEKVFGVSWFREDPSLLLISGTRGIRIADIRDHGSLHSSLSIPNPMMGVCTEPNHGYRFACYSRNLVYIYDRRYLSSSPLHEVEACSNAKVLTKLAWHPQRLFQLSALAMDSGNLIHLSISPSAFRPQHNSVNTPPTDQPSAAVYKQLNPGGTEFTDEQGGYSYATHLYSVPGMSKIRSFDWHSTIDERLAVLSKSESPIGQPTMPKKIQIINIREGISCDIGASGHIAIVNGQRMKLENVEQFFDGTNRFSIADTFKRRIKAGYGYGNTQNPFATLIENSRKVIEMDQSASFDLRFCWNWLWMMFQSTDAQEMQKDYGTMFVGIKHILRDANSTSTNKEDVVTFRNRIFVNEKRLKILRLCNWPNFADREECKAKFDEMSERGGVQGIIRAAALALFSVQGTLSKEYLTTLSDYTHSREFVESTSREGVAFVDSHKADTVLNVLQKYDGFKVPNYDTICQQLEGNDYLLAIVRFLARRERVYTRIHNEIFESNLLLEDKLAFAAIHMDDDAMSTALDKLVKVLLVKTPLSALLVVGLDDQPSTHQIFHRYLDLTGDFQTTSLLFIIGNCFRGCRALSQDATLVGVKAAELLESAIESEPWTSARRRSLHTFRDYVDLLNRWKFWLPKTFICSFLRSKPHSSSATIGAETPTQSDARSKLMTIQAVIACNFCGSPIFPAIAERIEALRIQTPKISPFSRRLGAQNSRARTLSCLCRKPLPKCVICRKHLSSQMEPELDAANGAGGGWGSSSHQSVIDHWVVWCSTCNHGGHLAHLRDWFSEYPVCAASGCDCQCMRRDHQMRDELLIGEREEAGTGEEKSDGGGGRP